MYNFFFCIKKTVRKHTSFRIQEILIYEVFFRGKQKDPQNLPVFSVFIIGMRPNQDTKIAMAMKMLQVFRLNIEEWEES